MDVWVEDGQPVTALLEKLGWYGGGVEVDGHGMYGKGEAGGRAKACGKIDASEARGLSLCLP